MSHSDQAGTPSFPDAGGRKERPVRLRLSRKKGFDLQAVSLATNGLPAVKVARPGFWGNPFVVTEKVRPGAGVGCVYIAVPSVEDAVACFGEMLSVETEPGQRAYELRRRLPSLGGHNLACWCALCPEHRNGRPFGVQCDACAPCHADILGELSNKLTCEAVDAQ